MPTLIDLSEIANEIAKRNLRDLIAQHASGDDRAQIERLGLESLEGATLTQLEQAVQELQSFHSSG